MPSLSSPRIVALIGFMGAGKSTVGPILARAIGSRFADLDTLVEEEAGIPIAEIFSTRGEPAFRELESLCLARLASGRERLVLAAGGGAPIQGRNRAFFAELARTFYLACPFAELMARTAGGGGRPLLSAGREEARRLYETRQPVYEELGLRVDTSGRTPEEVARRIVELLRGEDEPLPGR